MSFILWLPCLPFIGCIIANRYRTTDCRAIKRIGNYKMKQLFLKLGTMIWMFVFPQNPYVKILTSKSDGISRGEFEFIKSRGWSPHGWDSCFYKRDLIELPSPFYHVRIQGEVCDPEEDPYLTQDPNLRFPISRTVSSTFLLFINWPVWYFVIATQMNKTLGEMWFLLGLS